MSQAMTMKKSSFDISYKYFINSLNTNSKENCRNYAQTKLPPSLNNDLLKRFLSDRSISAEIRLHSIYTLLNRTTQEFCLNKKLWNTSRQISIIRWLSEFSEGIQILNLSNFYISFISKNIFINLLKKSKSLKSLHVKCDDSCVISQLLLENFENLEEEVQTALRKIVFIDIDDSVCYSNVDKILKLLPNVQSLGKYRLSSRILYRLNKDTNIQLNLNEFRHSRTKTNTINVLLRSCPKLKYIHLKEPYSIIQKLSNFPELTSLCLDTFCPLDLDQYLNTSGHSINKLRLCSAQSSLNIQQLIHKCPNLEKLVIKESCVFVNSKERMMFPKIKEFKFKSNSIDGSKTIIPILRKMPNVQVLNLSETKITWKELKKLVESKVLDNVRKFNMDLIFGELLWIRTKLPNLELDVYGKPM